MYNKKINITTTNIVLLKTKLQLEVNTKMIQIYGCKTCNIFYQILKIFYVKYKKKTKTKKKQNKKQNKKKQTHTLHLNDKN